MITVLLLDFSISAPQYKELSHIFSSTGMSAEKSGQQGSQFSCPLQMFAVSCGPQLLVEDRLLNDSLGCSHMQALIRSGIAMAELTSS